MAKKVYAVRVGRETGIFNTWDECKKQVDGFPKAEYKSFKRLEEAQEYIGVVVEKTEELKEESVVNAEIDYNTFSVDGACSGNPGDGEYQCVDTKTEEVIFKSEVLNKTTNNLMEFISLVKCLQYMKDNNINKKVYSDSISAIAWVRNKKTKTTLELTKENRRTFELVDECIDWLKNNNVNMNQILKWDTKNWGEIPADFGRK